MKGYDFGYPKQCTKCSQNLGNAHELTVEPFLHEAGPFRLMLVGQDPTISRDPARVRCCLMLDRPTGQIRRWLQDVFGEGNFDKATVYATNVVKCTFNKPPSDMRPEGVHFLEPYFQNCRQYLLTEIDTFQPNLMITFGEPAHRLLVTLLNDVNLTPVEVSMEMQSAFTGSLYSLATANHGFDYSPCLHIRTFRVAETYGPSVNRLKEGLASYLEKKI